MEPFLTPGLAIILLGSITLGGLQSISQEYYEASEIDGASGRAQFFSITLPLLRPVLIPAVLLGVFLTFNNINVPYFINQNELETSEILVSALYRAAFNFSRTYADESGRSPTWIMVSEGLKRSCSGAKSSFESGHSTCGKCWRLNSMTFCDICVLTFFANLVPDTTTAACVAALLWSGRVIRKRRRVNMANQLSRGGV